MLQFKESEWEQKSKIKKWSVYLVYVIIASFFLVNGETLLSPVWNSSWTWTIIVYMVMVALYVQITDKLPEETKSPILHSLLAICILFPLVTAVFWILKDFNIYFQSVRPMAYNQILPHLVYQLVIVASSEELIFRGAVFGFLKEYYKKHWWVAYLGSSLLFAMFHLAAYGMNPYTLTIAFLMGMIFAYCVDRWNIGVAIALHFTYNAYVIGATAL